MEIVSTSRACYETLKRYWRKRRYQKLHSSPNTRRKLKIVRLGGAVRRRLWKIRTATPKLQWKKLASPLRMLINFHESYVDLMIGLANKMGKVNGIGEKKVSKDTHISILSYGDDVVDTRLALEIYKRLIASRSVVV